MGKNKSDVVVLWASMVLGVGLLVDGNIFKIRLSALARAALACISVLGPFMCERFFICF